MRLASFLTMMAKPVGLAAPRQEVTGIFQPAEEPSDFVEPEFGDLDESVNEGEDPVPAVLLVSAPAAVGKTWLARAISARTGNPLWDLSGFRLGSHFFTGTLAQTYGGAGFAEMEARLRGGTLTIVLDAADEAVVSSGLTNFEAALADLASIVRQGANRTKASVVILGRPDTLELAGVMLSENSLSWKLLNVAYFSEAEAKAFVMTKIGTPSGTIGTEAVSFVSDFFETVQLALADQAVEQTEFLGYAPVLDAVARFYLNEPNPHATFQRLKRDPGREYAWQLLLDVVKAICERETDKLANALSSSATCERVARLNYSWPEQVRMLSAPDPESVMIYVPADIPSADQQRVIMAWKSQFGEHPFLRRQADRRSGNPYLRFAGAMFRDFVAAQRLLSSDTFDILETVDFLLDDHYVPSPILARLLIRLIDDGGAINAQAIPPILDSLSADSTRFPLEFLMEDVVSEHDDENWELAVSFTDGRRILAEGRCVDDGLQAIQLGRSLVRATIDVPTRDVEIPSARSDFLLGSGANLICKGLAMNAAEVRVQTTVENPAVVVCESFISRTMKTFPSQGEYLRLSAPSLRYPWRTYLWEKGDDPSDEFLIYNAAIAFRRFYRWFLRSSMKGRLSYPKTPFDNIISKRRASWHVFAFLTNQDYIEQRGDSYYLSEPVSALSIMSLRLADRDYRALLARYVEWLDGADGGR